MKVKYSNNSTRWEVILFKYSEDIPLSTKPTVEVINGNKGVVSLNISRSKASVQNAASIQIVGEVNSAYAVGNWLIIKSKAGKFKEKDTDFTEVSPLSEGLIRFIGQITTIENNYSVLPNGLLSKKATIHIREWSSVLNIPIRLDANAFSKYFNETSNAQGRIGLLGGSFKKANAEINIEELAKDLIDPFVSASLVLAIIGSLNTDKQSGVDLQEAIGKYAGLISLAKLISRMPTLPQELLRYLNLPSSVTAEQPFSTGFVNTLAGVMKAETPKAPTAPPKEKAMNSYGKQSKDPGSFDGYFSSYDDLKQLFKNYQDRPLTSNFLAGLSKGLPAWELIQQQLDMTTNEAFTDIWYFKKSESEPIISLPMIVLRDKPFALKVFLENTDVAIKSTKWTAFDDIPRIFVSDELIQGLSTVNSFFNSPNYIEPDFRSGEVGSVRGDSPQAIYAKAVHRIIDNPAIDRFGTIEHYWSTVYSAPIKAEKGQVLYVNWFEDTKKLMYYWHTLNYRFGNANLSLKDNNLPIMVGCNISFPLGENVLCGHVESISWSFGIQMDGTASTITNVQLSYLCLVKENGQLSPIGPTGFTNLMNKKLISPETESILEFPGSTLQAPSAIKLSAKLKTPKVSF